MDKSAHVNLYMHIYEGIVNKFVQPEKLIKNAFDKLSKIKINPIFIFYINLYTI